MRPPGLAGVVQTLKFQSDHVYFFSLLAFSSQYETKGRGIWRRKKKCNAPNQKREFQNVSELLEAQRTCPSSFSRPNKNLGVFAFVTKH